MTPTAAARSRGLPFKSDSQAIERLLQHFDHKDDDHSTQESEKVQEALPPSEKLDVSVLLVQLDARDNRIEREHEPVAREDFPV